MASSAADAAAIVQETLLGEAIATAGAAVFLSDDTLRYVAVNQAACDLVGCSRDELLSLRVDDVVAQDRAPLVRAAQRTADGHVSSGTVTLRRRDGTTTSVQYASFPATVAGLSYVVSVVW